MPYKCVISVFIGQTTVMNLLLDTVRAQGKIELALASSGIAATLLHGGRTVYSGLNVPLSPNSKMCSIPKRVVWHKYLESVHLSFGMSVPCQIKLH